MSCPTTQSPSLAGSGIQTLSYRRKFMRSFNALAVMALFILWSVSASATPIYAIRDDGDMLFYKHTGTDSGSADSPIQAKKIGNGWNFRHVFAGEGGAIYAITDNGDMLFYKHTGSTNGPTHATKIGKDSCFWRDFADDGSCAY